MTLQKGKKLNTENCEPEILELESKEHSADFNCTNCNQTDCCYWIYYNEINKKEDN